MILDNEQSTDWNNEAIAYLIENEYEWVNYILEDNEPIIHIFADNSLSHDEYHEYGEERQETGDILLGYSGKCQYILHN